jgi:probable phosphoglycerate mutase
MKLLLIRHGQTKKNLLGLTHEIDDLTGLNEEGRQQAFHLAPVCKNNAVERLFSSKERRALETAQIMNKQLQVPLEELPELGERNWGEWTGLTWSEIRKNLDLMTIEQRYSFVPPGGESWKQMDERLNRALIFLVVQQVDSLAIITHGGLLGALFCIIKSIKKEDARLLQFDNCSVTTVVHHEGEFDVLSINDTTHLTKRR